MRRDHRPYWMHALWERYEDAWANHFLAPHFEKLGDNAKIVRPWNVEVFGPNVEAGESIHVVSRSSEPVQFTVWSPHDEDAHIKIGNCCFFAGGVRILAGRSITIGDGALIAKNVVISDSDWHGVYNRVDPHPPTEPVVIGDNVWIGHSAFIAKGVAVGDNAVIGAHSVVTGDVPANTVVAGIPAKQIKSLDPDGPFKTRMDMLGDPVGFDRFIQTAYREKMKGNTTWGWLMSKFWPRRGV